MIASEEVFKLKKIVDIYVEIILLSLFYFYDNLILL